MSKTFSVRQVASAIIYRVTGIKTRTFRDTAAQLRREWRDHAREIQFALNEERQRGWGWSAYDGRRIDRNGTPRVMTCPKPTTYISR